MSSTLKNRPKNPKTLTFLLEALKDFELLYNLSPRLSPKQVLQLQETFLKIVNAKSF
jgi:hypothetical protein